MKKNKRAQRHRSQEQKALPQHTPKKYYTGYGGQREAKMINRHEFANRVVSSRGIPTIVVSQDALFDMFQLVSQVTTEIGWLGTVRRSGNTFLVEEIFLPEQEAHGTTTNITQEGISKLGVELLGQEDGLDKLNRIRFWGHSHVWMGTSPSAQDDTQMELLSQNCPDYFIRAIVNKEGRMELTLYLYDQGVIIEDCSWDVYRDDDESISRRERWASRIKDTVSRARNGYYGGYGGYNPAGYKQPVGDSTACKHYAKRWDSTLQCYFCDNCKSKVTFDDYAYNDDYTAD